MTTSGSEAGLNHYFRVLKHGFWIVALAVALATIGAVYASLRQEKLYRSSADVFLGTQNLAAGLSNIQLPSSDPVRQAATQANLARTQAVAQRALELAHLSGRSPEQLLARSSVSSAVNADILTFSVTDPKPNLAARLAGAYATAYTRYRHDLDTASIARALRQVEQRLAQLKATGGQDSAGYASLLGEQDQLTTLEALQGSNALLVRSAGPAVKTQPKPLRNGLLAGLLGLMLGVGLAFLRDGLNTRVRTAAEVQERLDLPLLARIAEPPRRLRAKNRLVMLSEPQSPAAEAYRILATNLDFVNLERSARTIMFTGAQRDEGKSTTVANLAVALARTGRRVVLLDLDLRSPSLAGFFYLDQSRGLTHVALGQMQLDKALARIPFREIGDDDAERVSANGVVQGVLEVLPVGVQPPNPAEFVGSHALGELLVELEQRADVVLIDAPPLLHLSDAMTLTSRVDALVVVTRLSLIRRPMLQELHRVLVAAPVTKLGFVLTGAGAGESYGDSYGYGYGGTRDKQRSRETVV